MSFHIFKAHIDYLSHFFNWERLIKHLVVDIICQLRKMNVYVLIMLKIQV